MEEKQEAPKQRQYIRYAFFKVDPAWRRLSYDERCAGKEALAAVYREEADRSILRAYSTIGTRADTDFLIWAITDNLAHLQEFTNKILRTPLGGYLTIAYSFLSMNRHSLYVRNYDPEVQSNRARVVPGDKQYMFLYPFTKTHEWYQLSKGVRQAMMYEHIRIGSKYPGVKTNTSYSYGLDDQDFMVSFEADDPGEFLDCVEEQRFADARPYTANDTPLFTCSKGTIAEVLDSIGG